MLRWKIHLPAFMSQSLLCKFPKLTRSSREAEKQIKSNEMSLKNTRRRWHEVEEISELLSKSSFITLQSSHTCSLTQIIFRDRVNYIWWKIEVFTPPRNQLDWLWEKAKFNGTQLKWLKIGFKKFSCINSWDDTQVILLKHPPTLHSVSILDFLFIQCHNVK